MPVLEDIWKVNVECIGVAKKQELNVGCRKSFLKLLSLFNVLEDYFGAIQISQTF